MSDGGVSLKSCCVLAIQYPFFYLACQVHIGLWNEGRNIRWIGYSRYEMNLPSGHSL